MRQGSCVSAIFAASSEAVQDWALGLTVEIIHYQKTESRRYKDYHCKDRRSPLPSGLTMLPVVVSAGIAASTVVVLACRVAIAAIQKAGRDA